MAKCRPNKTSIVSTEKFVGVREVRLSGAEGEESRIVSIQEALDTAVEAGMDLVEISPNAEPPVCRVMDYGKFLFEKSKAAKEQKKSKSRSRSKKSNSDLGLILETIR